MEMPELFGNAYILPVVIVVVLLLVLLLILMTRKRRRTGPTEARSAERVVAPPARPTPTEAPEAPPTPFVPTTQTTAVTPQPAVPGETPAFVKPSTTAGGAAESGALADDPLKAVVVDIVHGWGDLTSEDTNRLALFRPDKVLAVAETIELPKDDAGGGYARTRLLQIRKYAADKQLEHKAPDTASPPGAESMVEAEAIQSEAAPLATEVKPDGSTPLWGSPLPEASAAGAGVAAAAVAGTFGSEQIQDRKSLEMELGEELAAEGSGEPQSSEPLASPPWPEESQPVEPAVSSPWPEESQPAEPATPSPWSEEPAGWDIHEAPAPEEVAVEPAEETLLVDMETAGIEAGNPDGLNGATAGVVTAGVVGAAVGGTDTETVDLGDAEELSSIDDMTAQVQTPEDSLSSLHVRVRTADELLALPPGDQADMLAFLEPPELARVIEASDDRKLKKAVIDVLENLGNPSSLDVLRRCLDDPDPEIQVYALDAADRLLGVE